jgi:alpha-1,6-mannosyltransferase
VRVPARLHTGVPAGVLATGFLGTCVLAIGGAGVGALPRIKDAVATKLHVGWFQEHSSTRLLASLLVGVGVILLAAAWWQLRPYLDRLSPRAVLIVAGLWSLPLLVAPPLFSRDLYAYAGQGHLVANHVDPYTYGPGDYEPRSKWSIGVDGVWRYSPSPYGPVWLWLAGMVVRVAGDHLVPAVLMLRLLAVSGLVLVAWGLPRLARAHGVPPQRALWLGLANPFVLIHGVGGGHNDVLMIGLLVCGLAVAGRTPSTRQLVLATALITVAALVKLPAAAALGFLPMLQPTWGARVRAALVIGATAAVTALVVTPATGLGWGWLHTLDAGSARLSIFSPLTGVGVLVGNGLTDLGVVDTPAVVLRLVLAGGFALGGALALGLLLRAHHLGPTRALGLTLVAVVALGPIVQPWYLLWGLVLLAAVGGERSLLPLGALSIALCLAIAPNGRSLIRPPLYGAPVVAAVAFAAFMVRRSTKQVLALAVAEAAAEEAAQGRALEVPA